MKWKKKGTSDGITVYYTNDLKYEQKKIRRIPKWEPADLHVYTDNT